MTRALPPALVSRVVFALALSGAVACGSSDTDSATETTPPGAGGSAAGSSSSGGAGGATAGANGSGAASGSGNTGAGAAGEASAGAAGAGETAGAGGDAQTAGAAGDAGAAGEEDDDPGDPDDGAPAPEVPPSEPPPPDAPDEPNDPDPTYRAITVASWNANYENDPPTVIAHIKQIDADVIGLQEMGSPAHAKTIVDGMTECKTCEYAKYFPQADNAHACPILWKKDKFERLDAGSFKVNDAQYIPDGGSRTHLLVKSTVWVKLEDKKTHARFFLSNNHLVPSVELNGKPYPGREKRLAMFTEHMDGILKTVDKANAAGLPIFITGDFNVNFRADKQEQSPVFPFVRFKKKDVFANWYYIGAKAGDGTHGTRLIDYVHVSKTKLVEPMANLILGKGGSDHNAVRMKVRLHRK